MVTGVPTGAVDAGAAEMLTAEQTGFNVYWKALNASYAFGLLRSRAQTENRYDPAALPALVHLIVGMAEYV
jgi:hypothetical protein